MAPATRRDIEALRPLVDEALALAAECEQERRKRLWAEHQALRATDRIPVCVYWEGIPWTQWKLMLGGDFDGRCESPLARRIEFDLRQRLWTIRNVPDDHVLWPSVTVGATLSRDVDWGASFGLAGDGDPEHARRYSPAFPDRIDLSRLKFADEEVDAKGTSLAREEAEELVEGRLAVVVRYPNLGFSPFDTAVAMRGMEGLMTDVIDAPEKVRELMDFITNAFEAHHLRRERRGWINVQPEKGARRGAFGHRVHCAYLADDFDPRRPRLRDEWAYVSAQTSTGLGPAMYEEFVQPFNQRLARHFVHKTVYYHGCECLDRKLDIIAKLANLRRHHVSPWSSMRLAAAKFGGRVVLEAHAHPGRVFFGMSEAEMKTDAKRLVAEAGGAPLDLNLSDIHSINGKAKTLIAWAQAARDAPR
jgi:hypothetical protein